jgi:hypothetical protein
MNRNRGLVWASLALVLLSASAFADSTVHMKFLGHGGTQDNPVYPWYFQVNGVNATLICDTLTNNNITGETWEARVTNILSGQGLFKNKLLDYKAAAVVFFDILFKGANYSDANWAIWALFDPSAKKSPHFNSEALALYNAALQLAPTLPKSFFAPFSLYTPIAGTQSCKTCGLPQEFIGYNSHMTVPEPGTLALMGTGLVAIAGLVRKRLVRPDRRV